MSGISYLFTGIGTAEENAGGGTSERGGLARVTEVAQARDGILNKTLLTETSLGESQKSGENDGLGHDGRVGFSFSYWIFAWDDKKGRFKTRQTGRAV